MEKVPTSNKCIVAIIISIQKRIRNFERSILPVILNNQDNYVSTYLIFVLYIVTTYQLISMIHFIIFIRYEFQLCLTTNLL